MKKLHDEQLAGVIAGFVANSTDPLETADEVVLLLKQFQDASGLKVVQNISLTDIAYKEVT